MMPIASEATVITRFRQLQELEAQLGATAAAIAREREHLKELRQEYQNIVDLMRRTVRDQAALPFDGQ